MKRNFLLILLSFVTSLCADVSLPNLYSDNAVIQRHIPFKVWGWADPHESISIEFLGKKVSTQANETGTWSVEFPAQKAGGPYSLTVTGKNKLVRNNLLFGEVWVCSGQSNMKWNIGKSVDGDLEVLMAKDDQLRIVTVSTGASQTSLKDIDGVWTPATGKALNEFSAVGYYFGRELRRVLNVPVGLINNAWGGSAIEAWIPREVLLTDERNFAYLKSFDERLEQYSSGQPLSLYEENLKKWEKKVAQAKSSGAPLPRKPRKPTDPRGSQHRPANLWHSRVAPLLNYSIKGVIWYQGEANTSRSYNYRHLLPMMIKTWRQKWDSGNFPFYWSQLADFCRDDESDGNSPWAEIRESMTVAMQTTENTGQAVITDLWEEQDIHPRRKLEVAKRLLRWALAKDYGFDVVFKSPMYESHEVKDNKIIITLDQDVKWFDVKKVLGFTIAGEDEKFLEANARISKNTIEVWHEKIKAPRAARYAWAGNPLCNVINKKDLPLTPFRTDKWKLSTE